MQKILKYTFSLNHKVEISNLPERVLDLTQKLSEWVPLQSFLHRQLGVWLYLKPGVLTEVWLSDQIRSVAQSCPTLFDPMNCSSPGLPVHHQLPEFTQTHVHRVSDASSHLILCRPLLLLPPIPHAKSWLIGKDSDAGRDWGQEEKGMTEDELAGCITDSMDVSLSELRELVMDREAWHAAIHGVTKTTDLIWSDLIN